MQKFSEESLNARLNEALKNLNRKLTGSENLLCAVTCAEFYAGCRYHLSDTDADGSNIIFYDAAQGHLMIEPASTLSSTEWYWHTWSRIVIENVMTDWEALEVNRAYEASHTD